MTSSAARRQVSCRCRGRPTPASARGITTQAILQNTSTSPPPPSCAMLADIVSKNGNLMLSVPLQRDGTPDSDEIKIVSDIGAWLKVNGEAIYATRPWKIFGEGPSTVAAEKGPVRRPEPTCRSKPFTPEDIRFTQSKDGKTLYAIVLAIPAGRQSHGQITRREFAKLAGQNRQRAAARQFRQIEIHPRRKRPARHVAGKTCRARSPSR